MFMCSIYDRIGQAFDSSRRADGEITRRLRSFLQVEDGARVLDIACGTGNYTLALAETGLRMTGVDISNTMIEQAKAKAHADQVDWFLSDAARLPLADSVFTGAVCVLAVHHFQQPVSVFQEVFRVLRKGKLVLFTSSPEQMEHYWLHAYFPEMMRASMEQMPSVEQVVEWLHQTGFHRVETEPYFVRPDLQDGFLYKGKHDPSYYLNPLVRQGMSSFARLADPEEVRTGCLQLEEDIRTGRIDEVIRPYHSSIGDYLFVSAEKPFIR
jgi:ubiquinone/menaquinone biosynthesis C-methylase UbiE